MLEFPEELEEDLRPLVSDYSFHLIEMTRLPEEVRRRFRSDFRILAEYAATRKEPEKWEEFLQTDSLRMLHLEEVLDALKAVSGDARYGQIMKQLTKKEKEEGVKMCVFAMLCREAFVRVGSLSAAACTQDLDIGHGGEPCQCAIESGGHYEETVLCLVACACCLGIDRGPPVWFTDGIAQLVVVIYACRD